MRVRFLTAVVAQFGAYRAGQVVDLEAEQAQGMVAAGHAVPVPMPPEAAVVPAERMGKAVLEKARRR